MALWPIEEKLNSKAKGVKENEPIGITYAIHQFSPEEYKERF
jgi:hypothetical protein